MSARGEDEFAALAIASLAVGLAVLCVVGLWLWVYCAPIDTFGWLPAVLNGSGQ